MLFLKCKSCFHMMKIVVLSFVEHDILQDTASHFCFKLSFMMSLVVVGGPTSQGLLGGLG